MIIVLYSFLLSGQYFSLGESTQPTDKSDALEKFITDAQCLTLSIVAQDDILEYHLEVRLTFN